MYYHKVVNLISDYNGRCRFNEKESLPEVSSVKIVGDEKTLRLKVIRDENLVIARLINCASQFRGTPHNSATGLIVCTKDMEMYADTHFCLSGYKIAIPPVNSDTSLSSMLEFESAEAAQEYIEKLEHLINRLCKDNATASDSTAASYDDCTVIN